MRNLTAEAIFAMAAMCDLEPSDITEADRETISVFARGLYSSPYVRAVVEEAAEVVKFAIEEAERKERRQP